LLKNKNSAFLRFLLILSCLVPAIFMGCELEAGVQIAEDIREAQTELEEELLKAESTLEVLKNELERTPESTVDSGEKSGQITEKTDDVDPVKEPLRVREKDEASEKQWMEFDSPAWMALGKLDGKDVSGRAGFEGMFVTTPSTDGGTDEIVTGMAEVTYSTGATLPYVKGEQPPTIDTPKYSPALLSKLENGDPGEPIDINVTLKDDLILTPLPRFKDFERGSDDWKKIDAVRQVEIQKIKDARKIQFSEFRDLLRGKINFEIVYLPWIANTPTITVRLDTVKILAELDQVINISLNDEASITQGPDLDAANDVLAVREQLRTIPYDGQKLNWGYLAVVDTGARITHDMLDDQSGAIAADCGSGGETCFGDGGPPNGKAGTLFPNYNNGDFYNSRSGDGHGTSVKAVISGSGDIASELRGITQVTTDSWKASPPYPYSDNQQARQGISTEAAHRALEMAIVMGSVISTHSYGSWARTEHEYDNAFDLGMGVFVASGNSACSAESPVYNQHELPCDRKVIRAPAISYDEKGVQMIEPAFSSLSNDAHKVITVGAHDIDPPCTWFEVNTNVCPYSGRGPAPDGRYKPDILGYTNWESAKANNDNDTGSFGGTSAATPTIAAMAQIYNNFLEKASNFASWLSPGHVYAAVLGSGEHQTFWEGSYNYIGVEPNISTLNIEGVGRPKMFVNGSLHSGSAQINDTGDIATVNLDVPNGACGIQAAIWWPEGSDQDHNDIDIHLVSPDGVTFAAGQSGKSVWERASIKTDTGLPKGIYKARIVGFDVNVKQGQQVFYSIHVQKTKCWDG